MSDPAIATLLVSCRDQAGIVAGLSDFVFRNNGNIVDLQQYADEETGEFFMRLQVDLSEFQLDQSGVDAGLSVLAQRFQLSWTLHDHRPQRVVVFCSKQEHCLYDLLLRQQMGELEGGQIVAVVSNHPDCAEAAGHFGVPYHHIPVGADKAAVEQQQLALLQELEADCVVLARYMQILSPDFCRHWEGRMINIHHSFLPAFAGAKPYQARAKGVKIIGATAHFVTADLDQGPIIAQDVNHVTERDSVRDYIRKGRDIERQVLARAVRLFLEHRLLINGPRTIVFD